VGAARAATRPGAGARDSRTGDRRQGRTRRAHCRQAPAAPIRQLRALGGGGGRASGAAGGVPPAAGAGDEPRAAAAAG
jgi:hypothetical protein